MRKHEAEIMIGDQTVVLERKRLRRGVKHLYLRKKQEWKRRKRKKKKKNPYHLILIMCRRNNVIFAIVNDLSERRHTGPRDKVLLRDASFLKREREKKE